MSQSTVSKYSGVNDTAMFYLEICMLSGRIENGLEFRFGAI